MNKIYPISLSIFILIVFSCKIYQKNIVEVKQERLINLHKTEDSEDIFVKVESINLDKNVYQIIATDTLNRKYKILSKKSNDFNKNIIVSKDYIFKLVQSTHLNRNKEPYEMVINGKKITPKPNHYIKDCIMFNNQDFCSNS